jgi:hypothetical protein
VWSLAVDLEVITFLWWFAFSFLVVLGLVGFVVASFLVMLLVKMGSR